MYTEQEITSPHVHTHTWWTDVRTFITQPVTSGIHVSHTDIYGLHPYVTGRGGGKKKSRSINIPLHSKIWRLHKEANVLLCNIVSIYGAFYSTCDTLHSTPYNNVSFLYLKTGGEVGQNTTYLRIHVLPDPFHIALGYNPRHSNLKVFTGSCFLTRITFLASVLPQTRSELETSWEAMLLQFYVTRKYNHTNSQLGGAGRKEESLRKSGSGSPYGNDVLCEVYEGANLLVLKQRVGGGGTRGPY